jgi:two-component system phosphate regulon response regulator OmpR
MPINDTIALAYNVVMDDTEPHLLVVDDDARLRELLRRYLSDSGFRVTGAADALEARRQLASFAFDLIVLDVMMPGESGLDLTRALRAEAKSAEAKSLGPVPVLLLTAMAEPEDRINGLEQGADDFLAKPFEPRELVLRIRNILQRRPVTEETAPVLELHFAGLRFDLARGELFSGDELVRLTAAESALLASLAQRAPEAVSREELSQSAQFSGNVRNVDVQMTRLRRKVEPDPRNPRYLQTVRGTGYALRPD